MRCFHYTGGGIFKSSLDKIKDYVKQNIFKGNSSQFVKGDGSLDNNVYITARLTSSLNFVNTAISNSNWTGNAGNGLVFFTDDIVNVNNVEVDDNFMKLGVASFKNTSDATELNSRYFYMGWGKYPYNKDKCFHVSKTEILYKGNKIWHAGNDSTGSGLDADLLDGVEGASYFKTYVLQPGNLDANDLNVPNINYVPNYDLNTSFWKDKTLTNFPNNLTTGIIAGGFSLRVIREGNYKKQIFTYYNSNRIYVRYSCYSSSGTVWSNWNEIALITSNVASADKLTTKQLTNEDLNEIKDAKLSSYIAATGNTCLNKPDGITTGPFTLICCSYGNGGFTQIINNSSIQLIRVFNGSIWKPWRQLATTDGAVAKLTTKQLTNEDLNTLIDINFTSYKGTGSTTSANQPQPAGEAFFLQVVGITSLYIKQVISYPSKKTYVRFCEAGTWSAWKKMLTEDDIASLITRIEALEAKVNSN